MGERRRPAGPARILQRPQQRSRSASSAGLLWRADSWAGRGPIPFRALPRARKLPRPSLNELASLHAEDVEAGALRTGTEEQAWR